MQLLDQVLASGAQIKAFVEGFPKDTPVTMVNILRFKEKSGNGDESGQQAYARYSKNVAPLLAKVGGKVLWGGQVHHTIIGDTETAQPHMVLVVQYPSSAKFLEMALSEEYKAISHDRELALEFGGLYASQNTAF